MEGRNTKMELLGSAPIPKALLALGLNGVLYAQSIADILSIVITVFMAVRLHKELTVIKAHFPAEKNEWSQA